MALTDDGFVLLANFIGEENCRRLSVQIDLLAVQEDGGGIRNLHKKIPFLQEYLNGPEFRAHTEHLLPRGAQLVRAILFNKTPSANWFVTWHQDRTVALNRVIADPGFRAWSLKDGVPHAQPPQALLEDMLTLRVHLDAANKDNGCLKVIPGSHRWGVLTPAQIQTRLACATAVYCEAPQYSALAMRPLLIHASSKAISPAQRRVLHLEFSAWPLPEGVEWG